MSDHSVRCCGVFKEAWEKVHGLKLHFWGGSFLVILMAMGGMSLLGTLLLIAQSFFLPHAVALYHAKPDLFMDPAMAIPVGATAVFLFYQLCVALYEVLIMLPMRMGLRLIPLRHVAGKKTHSLFTFKYISWKYIGRFVALTVLVLLAIGIPAGLGLSLWCLPNMYHFGFLLKGVSYVVGLILFLFAIYLAVAYTFVNLLVIDRDISAWQAMTLSRQAVAKKWFCIFGTLILLGIILALSTLIFVFPLIWTVPFAHNVIAVLYRDMLGIEGKDPVSLCEATHQ